MKLRWPMFGRKPRPSMVMFGEQGSAAVTWGASFGRLRDVSPAGWLGP